MALPTEPLFAQQLQKLPQFQLLLDCHQLLHNAVDASSALVPARTPVSDDRGVFHRESKDGSSALRVQTFTSPSPAVDWAHFTTAAAPGYCYTKSSVFAPDTPGHALLPHLELEMGLAAASQHQLLLYINMDPRLSLELHPDYLERFYTSPPPAAAAAATDPRSWMAVDADAAARPGFTRFTSPSLHVRAFSSSAILYNVALEPGGASAAKEVLAAAVDTWLAWSAQHDATAVPAGDQQQQLLQEVAARSVAWRRFPRREASAGFMRQVFGGQVMDDYWDSMAGDARLRGSS